MFSDGCSDNSICNVEIYYLIRRKGQSEALANLCMLVSEAQGKKIMKRTVIQL